MGIDQPATRAGRAPKRRLLGLTLAAVLAASGLATPQASAEPQPGDVLVDETFSGSTIPSGFTPVAGDWSIVDGRLQATTGNDRARIAFGPTAPEHFRLDTTVRFVKVANPSRWLNIGVDYHAAQDFGAVLVARSQTTSSNGLELAQAASGGGYASSPVAAAPTNIGVGEDHRLSIEVHGSSMTVSLDGRHAMSATNLKRTGGAFGFVLNNSTVQFDDVRLTALAAPATGPSAPQQVRIGEQGDSATLTWSAPADPGTAEGGAPATVTGYEVSLAPASAKESDLTWVPASGGSHTFTGVSDAAPQVARVRATNSAGLAGTPVLMHLMRGAPALDGLKLRLTNGPWPTSHVQGIAVDVEKGFIYYSFTTLFVKTDLAGNLVGTVGGFTGHLGDLDINPADGRVYGSLEYKAAEAFYIAIFDVDEINEIGMDAQNSHVVSTVHLQEVVDDYAADMDGDGVFDGNIANTPDHRYGSSGIDGTAFGPKFGKTDGKQYLTVAYGIYKNVDRVDNDHQVLLQYDTAKWAALERPLTEADPHRVGPKKVDGKYFVFTGNTTYGVQNLEYDAYLQRWWMGVYKGTKPQYPNYLMFAVDAKAKPTLQPLTGLGGEKGLLLPLADDGLQDPATGIRGWNRDASVGIQSLDNGLYYLAVGTSAGGQGSILTLEAWTGDDARPFVPVTTDFQYPWQRATTYVAGDVTRFEGSQWKATWWTQGQMPGDPNGPWQEIVTAADGTAVWTPSRIFTAGDVVQHGSQRYTARWWTRNQEPGGQNGPWTPIG